MTVDVFDLSAKIKLDITEYEKGLNTASKDSRSVASKLGSGLSKAAKIGGAALGAASAAAGVFMKKSLEAGKQFDSSMSQVGATLGYSVEEINDETTVAGQNMKKLRDFAQEMGRTTKFSATQSADALNYMALAGYDAEKSMSMLPTVLNMASAGNMDLATASDMVTDAQTALNLSMDDTAKMTDQMAKAASSSNTSVSQLGSAFLTVGATARSVKGGTKEMSQVLGLMADNGIKGSEAGTKYRNMLLKLIKPTKDGGELLKSFGEKLGHDIVFDEKTHEMRSFKDIFLDLDKAMEGMAKGDRDKIMANLFNTRDLSAANALLGTTKDRWDELGAKIDDAAGSAQKMAGVQLDNLQGDVTLFKSAWEGLQIAVSDGAVPAVRDFVKFGTDGVSKLAGALKNGGIGEMFATLGDVISEGMTKIVKGLPKAIEAGGKLITAIGKGLVKAAPQLSSSIVETVKMLSKYLTDNIGVFVDGGAEIVTSIVNGIAEASPTLIPQIADLVLNLAQGLLNNLPTIVNAAMNLIMGVAQGILKAIPKIVKALPKLIKSLVQGILSAIPQIIQAGVDLLTSLVTDLPEIIDSIVVAIPEIISGIIDALVDNIDQIIDAGVNLLTALVEDLPTIISTIVEAIPKIIEGIFNAFTKPGALGKIISAGLKIATKLFVGILKIIPQIPSLLWKLAKKIWKYFTDPDGFLKDMFEAGKGIFSALWDGLKSIWEDIKEWFSNIGDWIVENFSDIVRSITSFIGSILPGAQGEATQFVGNMAADVYDEAIETKHRVDRINRPTTVTTSSGYTYVKAKKGAARVANAAVTEMQIQSEVVSQNKEIVEKLDELIDTTKKGGNVTVTANNREIARLVNRYA